MDATPNSATAARVIAPATMPAARRPRRERWLGAARVSRRAADDRLSFAPMQTLPASNREMVPATPIGENGTFVLGAADRARPSKECSVHSRNTDDCRPGFDSLWRVGAAVA